MIEAISFCSRHLIIYQIEVLKLFTLGLKYLRRSLPNIIIPLYPLALNPSNTHMYIVIPGCC